MGQSASGVRNEPAQPKTTLAASEKHDATELKAKHSAAAIVETSAPGLLKTLQKPTNRPAVLYLYASYCGACRELTPSFVELARTYQQRGVSFVAASVDRDRSAFAEYARVLGDVLPAVWVRPEGITGESLVKAGVLPPNEDFAIPLWAAFDKSQHMVSRGGEGQKLSALTQTLDRLLSAR